MAISNILFEMGKDIDQQNLMNVMSGTGIELNNPIRAFEPNDDCPLPWYISKFPNTSICSIISKGKHGVENTVVSMIPIETAERVLLEIKG